MNIISFITASLLAFNITNSSSEKAFQHYIDAHSKTYDYAERWKAKNEGLNFTHPPEQHTPIKDYLLFNFYDPKSQNSSVAWWTTWKQLRNIKTVADIYDQLALLPTWGPKLAFKVAVVPYGCDVYIQSGHAREQPIQQKKSFSSYLNGQGKQKFFMNFDERWIIGDIDLKTTLSQNQQEMFVKTMQTYTQTQQILSASGKPFSVRQLQNIALTPLKKCQIDPELLRCHLSNVLEAALETKLSQFNVDLKLAETHIASVKKILDRCLIEKFTTKGLLTAHLSYIYLVHDFNHLVAIYTHTKKFKESIFIHEKTFYLENLWQRLKYLEQTTIDSRSAYLAILDKNQLLSVNEKTHYRYEEDRALFQDIEYNYKQFKLNGLQERLGSIIEQDRVASQKSEKISNVKPT